MKILLCFVLLAALASVVLADVDVSGKWSGSFNVTSPSGETNESTAVLNLKQSGTEITGTVGPTEDEQFAIQKGKIEGDKITLDVDHEGNTLAMSLVLTAGRITGEAQMSHEGQTMKAKIDVSRAK